MTMDLRRMEEMESENKEIHKGIDLLLNVENAAREYAESRGLKMSMLVELSETLHALQEEKFEKLCDALEALDEWRSVP